MKTPNKSFIIAALVSLSSVGIYLGITSMSLETPVHPHHPINTASNLSANATQKNMQAFHSEKTRSNQTELGVSNVTNNIENNGFVDSLDELFNSDSNDLYQNSTRINELLTQWAQIDPEAALEWLHLVDDESDMMDGYFYNVIAIYMESDFHAAGDAIAGLPSSSRKQRLVYNYVSEYTRIDPEQALYWSEISFEGELAQIAKHQILNTLVYVDPNKVLSLLASDITNNASGSYESHKEMAFMASSRIDSDDFKYERISLYQYPEELHSNIAYAVASNWNKGDSEGAKNWIDSLPPSEAKQQALRGYSDLFGAHNTTIQ
ncbi:hypothetical protein [Agarilytica rhodophyticola]|uniref:hypothetical protein n=1 Tax=Agarilytica rhodophyticola TaxID=1737490 RepID=UPI000B343E3C|nr:hypothetical protein [Agarilytica rhodophyticola]